MIDKGKETELLMIKLYGKADFKLLNGCMKGVKLTKDQRENVWYNTLKHLEKVGSTDSMDIVYVMARSLEYERLKRDVEEASSVKEYAKVHKKVMNANLSEQRRTEILRRAQTFRIMHWAQQIGLVKKSEKCYTK